MPVCPRCQCDRGADAVLCIDCGIDLRTGRPIPTAHGDDAEPPRRVARAKEAPPPPAWALAIGAWLPGLLRLSTALAGILVSLLAAGVAALALFIFSLGAPFAAVTIGAAGLILHAQGVARLLSGRLGLLHDVLTEIDGRRWGLFLLLTGGPLATGLVLLKVASGEAPE